MCKKNPRKNSSDELQKHKAITLLYARTDPEKNTYATQTTVLIELLVEIFKSSPEGNIWVPRRE
jgi:hypothetical protein